MAIPLGEAYLCPDCDIITDSSVECPKCSGKGLLSLARVLNRSAPVPFDDWPECQEFYELMQYYRHFPIVDPSGVKDAYESVKDWLRRHRERHPKEETCS